MAVNPLLPPANRGAGIGSEWAGDDQQWWDWYVTLAAQEGGATGADGEVAELVPGPPRPDVEPATDEEVTGALAAPYALSDEVVEAFARDTFIKLPGVLPPAVVLRLADRLEELLRAAHGDATAGRFLALEQMWVDDPLMRAVALSPRLGDLAARLLAVDAVRLYHDNALSKEPGCGRTPWHHDAEHFPFTPPTAVTAWMPVSAIPAPMGPLSFAVGAGVRPMLADLPFDKVGTSYDRAVTERLRRERVRVVDSPYAVGEISFHSAACFHTAGPNRTVLPRRALATTYVADGVRVVDAPTMVSGAWRDFLPGVQPGGLVDSPLNPLLRRVLS